MYRRLIVRTYEEATRIKFYFNSSAKKDTMLQEVGKMVEETRNEKYTNIWLVSTLDLYFYTIKYKSLLLIRESKKKNECYSLAVKIFRNIVEINAYNKGEI